MFQREKQPAHGRGDALDRQPRGQPFSWLPNKQRLAGMIDRLSQLKINPQKTKKSQEKHRKNESNTWVVTQSSASYFKYWLTTWTSSQAEKNSFFFIQ